jgi:hypothetical protein
VTVLSEVIETVQVRPEARVHPVHTLNSDPDNGRAVRVAVDPLVYGDVFPVTLPDHTPALLTVRL